MEESIRSLCKGVATFCNHLQSSCDALKTSVDRRPIPLDSASSTFLQSLNSRVSAASTQLNILETMSLGTVSFEELLGHCTEVYKDNQNRLIHVQDRLFPSGYVPEPEIDSDDSEKTQLDSEDGFDQGGSDEEEDSLLDEALSLKKLGISDASLATLASQANAKNEGPDISYHDYKASKGSSDSSTETSGAASRDELLSDSGKERDKLKLAEAPLPLVNVARDDYESLPSYMKSLAPWEALLAAVDKMNSSLKQKATGERVFLQDEISSLGLGFRFNPTDQELIFLLYKMAVDREPLTAPYNNIVHEEDLFGAKEPWRIWEDYGGRKLKNQDLYFFSQLRLKGSRIERKLGCGGTWSEGEPSKLVYDDDEENKDTNQPIGRKRKLRYENRGSEHHSGWYLDEYSLFSGASSADVHDPKAVVCKNHYASTSTHDFDFVICRLRRNERAFGNKRKCCSSSSPHDQSRKKSAHKHKGGEISS